MMKTTGTDLALLAEANSPRLAVEYRQFVKVTRRRARDVELSNPVDSRDRGIVAKLVAVLDRQAEGDLAASRHDALKDAISFVIVVQDALKLAAELEDSLGLDAGLVGDIKDSLYEAYIDRPGEHDRARDAARALGVDLVRSAQVAQVWDSPDLAEWIGLWADVTWIIYVLLGFPYVDQQEPVRPAELAQPEVVGYIGAFEGAFAAIESAGQEGLIAPDHFEGIRNLLRQLELVRQRPAAKTQQLELIIVELLEILNGSIQDETKFREEFLRIGAGPDTAAIAAHELVRAIELAELRLGNDDPVESGTAMQEIANVNEALDAVEEPLRKMISDGVLKGATGAVGAGLVAGTAKGWMLYADDFMRIAREVIRGLSQIFDRLF